MDHYTHRQWRREVRVFSTVPVRYRIKGGRASTSAHRHTHRKGYNLLPGITHPTHSLKPPHYHGQRAHGSGAALTPNCCCCCCCSWCVRKVLTCGHTKTWQGDERQRRDGTFTAFDSVRSVLVWVADSGCVQRFSASHTNGTDATKRGGVGTGLV